MFKKLKDKITEEVKSSPQRIQQFAQAAQAAVTSASSSISDISNNDLFSIADDETPQNSPLRPGFRDVSLNQSPLSQTSQQSPGRLQNATGDTQSESVMPLYSPGGNVPPPSRLRRLSNGSNASDVSFRLPSYETPGSMYHLQSDLEASASEMEDGMSVPAQLERLSKEHLYAAYRRTNEKYNKYRGRYTDLARHYRNLERENVKARAVLVETQDKALRRISELREQCALEQSAKAHLENALRLELDERNLKIDSLNTKIKLLQSYSSGQPQPILKDVTVQSAESQTQQSIPDSQIVSNQDVERQSSTINGESASPAVSDPSHAPLIDFSTDRPDAPIEPNNPQPRLDELQVKHSSDMHILNNKIQKLEQLLVKCKETIKLHKEKNGQLTAEIQIASTHLDKKVAECERLTAETAHLDELRRRLDDSENQLTRYKTELDAFEAKKAEDISVIQSELDSSREQVKRLSGDVDVLNKREEENVISLAENKLSVHKELETKEKEIVILKNSITGLKGDLENNHDIIDRLYSKITALEAESIKINTRLADFDAAKEQIADLEGKIVELKSQNGELDAKCATLLENIKCNELQLKQEADEKLAVIDRNNFLEGRNKHLADENAKKNSHVARLEKEIMDIGKDTGEKKDLSVRYEAVLNERNALQTDYEKTIESKEALENELNEVNAKSKELEIRLTQFSGDNDRLKTELDNRVVEVDRLVSQSEENESHRIVVCDELNRLRDEYGKKCEDVDSLEKKLSEALKTNESQETESVQKARVEMKEKFDGMEVEMAAKYDGKLAEFERLRENYERINEELSQSKEKVLESQSNADEVQHLHEEYSKLLKEKNKCDQELQSCSAELDISKSECIQLSAEKAALEGKVSSLEAENREVKLRTDSTVEDVEQLRAALSAVQESHSQIVAEKSRIEGRISEMEQARNQKRDESHSELEKRVAENDLLNDKIKMLDEEKCKVFCEKEELEKTICEKTEYSKSLEIKLKEYSDNNEVWQQKLSNILDENNTLQEKCTRLKQDKESLAEKVILLDQRIVEFDTLKPLLEEAKLEKEFLNLRVTQLETDLGQRGTERDAIAAERDTIRKDLAENSDVIRTLKENVSECKVEIGKVSSAKETLQRKFNEECAEKVKLGEKLHDFLDMSKNLDSLSEENKASEVKISQLQDKISLEEKVSHEKIERLTEMNSDLVKEIEILKVKVENAKEVVLQNDNLKEEIDKMSLKIRVLEKIESEHSDIQEEVLDLRSERSKLVSDAEGLRTHLTKMSADNSELNDRLREAIANGEVMRTTHRTTLEVAPDDVFDRVGMETRLNKLTDANGQLLEELRANEDLNGRISDLERQNSILVEEKLELEDQIKASMDQHSRLNTDGSRELDTLRIKHREILSDKAELEGRLADLERISRSGEGNLKGLERKNEKLRLTNEKLERRLDEALVSLNHIRTLEENTELEYLRNILYEYLTGPTSNNMILAKVLSAVVKFDQRQTHLVLEREKERQGVLGQLGLL